MVSLVELAPLRDEVEVRGQKVQIKGLSADFIVTLLTKSNELRLLLAQRKLDPENAIDLVTQAPVAIAECIACATNKQGDPTTIAFALTELNVGETLGMIGPIFKLTFPQGVKSFIDGLDRLAREATGGSGWAAAMKLQETSSAASEPVTTAAQSGDIPQGNSLDTPS